MGAGKEHAEELSRNLGSLTKKVRRHGRTVRKHPAFTE
jgi:hypothetical protein